MDWLSIIRTFATVITIIASVLVAINVSAMTTAVGFLIFIAASITWILAGWMDGLASLVIQNSILLLVNIAGVYRWLPRATR